MVRVSPNKIFTRHGFISGVIMERKAGPYYLSQCCPGGFLLLNAFMLALLDICNAIEN